MVEVAYTTAADLLTHCKRAQSAQLDETDDRLEDAILQASEIVYNLTGRQFLDTQTAIVRPALMCACGYACSCSPNRVNLGLWPITALLSVRYDGAYQSVSEFHIDDYRYLVRNDGTVFPENRWVNQAAVTGSADDNVSDGYVFEVMVEYGTQAPRLVRRATRDLACKLLEDCLCEDGDCGELSDRVTSVSRQGVTFSMVDPLEFTKRAGGTGIYSVDLAIQTFNPTKMQSPAFVWTPDLSSTGHVTRPVVVP